jgi:REP-associated tyrosine transposase
VSNLRRLFLCDRYFFVTVNLRRDRGKLDERDYTQLVATLARMRSRRGFLLTAWVFLPDHWHAIVYPRSPASISQVIKAVKVSSMIAINRVRHEAGELWQGRFFDHALRTVKEYHETVEYILQNPVRRGLVKHPREWKWSSYADYAGPNATRQTGRCGLSVDRVRLPAEERTPI